MSTITADRENFIQQHFCFVCASWLLTALLMLILPTAVQAQLTFTTNNGAITITGYQGLPVTVTIPAATNGYPVTSIGDGAFSGKSSLTSVVISSGVTTIGRHAFSGDHGLTNITIPVSVTSIEDGAFGNCKGLTGVTIPDSVINIGEGVFFQCYNLTNVTIGKSIRSIGISAFAFCGLTNVTIPDSLTQIAGNSFDTCLNLTSVTIGRGVTNIGPRAFAHCVSLRGIFFKGDAANVFTEPFDGGSFYDSYDATIYYLPGTTGWGATLGDLPTVLWNPQFQVNDANFGVQHDEFGFNIMGTQDIPIVLEAGAELANPVWQPLQSCTLTNGSVYFSDPDWTNYPTRIYRIRSP